MIRIVNGYCDTFSQPTVQFTFYRPDLTHPEGTCKSSEDCGTKEICHIRNGYASGICKRNAKYIKTLYFMLELLYNSVIIEKPNFV